MKRVLILGLILLVLISSGCSSETTYEQPKKIIIAGEPAVTSVPKTQAPDTTSPPITEIPPQTEAPTTQPPTTQPPTTIPPTTSPPTEAPKPKIQTFNIGETASDDKVAITVNSVKYVQNIDEQNNQFLIATAPEGKKYAVIDITLQNIMQDKTKSISSIFQVELIDWEGYSYDEDFTGQTALEKSLGSGELLPETKKRGQVAFLIPKASNNNKFYYKFDIFSGTTAVFNLPDTPTVYSTTFDTKPEPKGTVEITTVKTNWIKIMDSGTGSISSVGVTVTNTGEISFEPAFDVLITKDGTVVSSNPDATVFISDLKPGESESESILVTTIIESPGTYNIKVDMRQKAETKVLATATKDVTIG